MASHLSRAAKSALTLLAASGFDQSPVVHNGISPVLLPSSLLNAQHETTKVTIPIVGTDPYKPTFEVTAPPYRNTDGAPCVVPLGEHTFAFSYGTPYVTTFPAVTTCDADHTVAYLTWAASSPLGVQYDRIAAVWVNGVELLRTSTEEPDRKSGVTWQVAKDVSQYADVLRRGGDVVIALDNVIDGPYNSTFSVAVTAEFYRPRSVAHAPRKPDLVVPVSKNTTSYGWFTVQPSSSATGSNSALVTLPANTEELYLELFLSHHQCDEFYYGNPPNGYAQANGVCGNGPFREVQVLVDNEIVGVVWPFPLLFTGGLNPYLWRPIVAIGAFDAPTYLVNLTPFVGKFVDNKPHNVTFFVDYGIDFWPIDGNLLVYVDAKSKQTIARVLDKKLETRVVPVTTEQIDGVDANFTLVASRALRVTSSVTTSKGTRIYELDQSFRYSNLQQNSQKGEVGEFDAITTVTSTLTVRGPNQQQNQQGGGGGGAVQTLATVVQEDQYPIKGKTFYRPFADGTYRLEAELANAFHRKLTVNDKSPAGSSAFRYKFVSKDVTATLQGSAQAQSGRGGNGTTTAAYSERSALDGCFTRAATAVNGVVLKDVNSTAC
jgi:hypothetical protein